MKDLKDKVALVTGAASGIGRALAVNLAREGAHAVLADVNEPGLDEVAEIIEGMKRRVLALKTDVADADEVKVLCERAVREMGGVDVLANVAGIAITSDLRDMDLDDWNRIIGINLYGPIHTIRYLIGHMIERGSGHIVNVSSGAGLVAVPWWAAYSTTKFALIGLTETLRAEVAGHGIGVTAICPGGVKTPIFDTMKNKGYDISGPLDSTLKYIGWTPERMSRTIVKAIKGNRPLVAVSISKFGYYAKRISPPLVYFLQKTAAGYASRYKSRGPQGG